MEEENWQVGKKVAQRKKARAMRCKLLVRKEGLEPSRFYPPDPKSGASANSATFALGTFNFIIPCSSKLFPRL